MTDIVGPIIVSEGPGNVIVFKAVADAEAWLEPWWIEGDEGTIYDAHGRILVGIPMADRVLLRAGVASSETRAALIQLLRADLTLKKVQMPEGGDLGPLLAAYEDRGLVKVRTNWFRIAPRLRRRRPRN